MYRKQNADVGIKTRLTVQMKVALSLEIFFVQQGSNLYGSVLKDEVEVNELPLLTV